MATFSPDCWGGNQPWSFRNSPTICLLTEESSWVCSMETDGNQGRDVCRTQMHLMGRNLAAYLPVAPIWGQPSHPSLQGKWQMRTLPCGHVPPSGVPVAFPLGKKRIPWRSCSSPQAPQGPSGSTRAGESGPRSILTAPFSLGRGMLGLPTRSHRLEVKNYSSGLLWQLGGKEFSCQCRTHTFDPWSEEDPTC